MAHSQVQGQPAPPAAHTFLLRAWFEPEQASSAAGVWRFSLEAPHTGARRGFADFEELVGFLADQLADSTSRPPFNRQEDGRP